MKSQAMTITFNKRKFVKIIEDRMKANQDEITKTFFEGSEMDALVKLKYYEGFNDGIEWVIEHLENCYKEPA